MPQSNSVQNDPRTQEIYDEYFGDGYYEDFENGDLEGMEAEPSMEDYAKQKLQALSDKIRNKELDPKEQEKFLDELEEISQDLEKLGKVDNEFEEEELDSTRCVIVGDDLFEKWKAFFPESHDDVKLRKAMNAALDTLEELKFIREFTKEPREWEIRRILKARLPVSELERLCEELRAEAAARARRTSSGDANE